MKEELKKYIQLLVEKEKNKQSRFLLLAAFFILIASAIVTSTLIFLHQVLGNILLPTIGFLIVTYFLYLYLDFTIEEHTKKIEEEERQYHPLKGEKGVINKLINKYFTSK